MLVASLPLVAMPGFLVAMPGATSSFLFLVAFYTHPDKYKSQLQELWTPHAAHKEPKSCIAYSAAYSESAYHGRHDCTWTPQLACNSACLLSFLDVFVSVTSSFFFLVAMPFAPSSVLRARARAKRS